MKILHRGLEDMDFDAVQKSLRQFAGINLDKNRRIPSNWVVVKEDMVTGDDTVFIVRMAVYPDTFTGFSKGRGQQTSGGYMGAGGKNLGIEIEVEDMTTGEYGSDRTFTDIPFDRQQEFFQDALGVISRTITSVSTIASPQHRQGDMAQTGVQRNPADWIVGDKVNVSRHTLDAGGLTVGYVVRVYPTSVDVMFPPDEYHVKGWTNEEKKEDLIYAGHDNNWRNTVNGWLKEQFYAEDYGEIAVNQNPPTWTELVSFDKAIFKRHIGNPSPLPITADVWTESDNVAANLEYMLKPFLLYDRPIMWSDVKDNTAIDGFEPYQGILRRRL
jgi:hypothetical protein|tara:strand:- start:41 stop:1024 length:984 start_codon:yes stop_codon:yes gene_type:complete